MDDAEKDGESDASDEGGANADCQDDVENEEEELDKEQADTDEEEPVLHAGAPSKSDEKIREASQDLSDVEEDDNGGLVWA